MAQKLSYITQLDSFGSLSARLIREEYGEEAQDWDYESLWLTLAREGFTLSDLARVKIQSFLVINTNPMAVWEVNTFQNTILAANNTYPIPEIVQESTPYELGWGMIEIRDYLVTACGLLPDQKIKWGDDVISYIAASLKFSGWVVAPRPLDLSQESLDLINKNTSSLKAKVLFEWGKIKNSIIEELEIPQTNEVNTQIARLRDFKLYLQLKFREFNKHKKLLEL